MAPFSVPFSPPNLQVGKELLLSSYYLPGSVEIPFAALGSFLLLSGQEETSVFVCIIIVVAEMPMGEGSEHHG